MKSLPIDSLLPEIVETLRLHDNLILTATPGAGKTTRLPPELLNVVKGRVAVLQPRRMAAVSACAHICEERGWRLGEEAGYQVRFESKFRSETRLIFMTDALLLRRMIDDPELQSFDLVVIDEFHERNLNQDLILASLKELQELGRKIKVLVMSATLDMTHLREYLPGAVSMEVPGQVFPLEIVHSNQPLLLQTGPEFTKRVSEAILQANRHTSGDVLAFLPGTGEIARVQESLENRTDREILVLHGSLTLEEQRKVLAKGPRARTILATNVAEASVTVPGVDCVVDCGLQKAMHMNGRSGFSELRLERISKFNAAQRSGRAARQKAGVCFRLWTVHEEGTQAEQPVPECLRVDLSSALLWLAQMGVRDFSGFSWFDAPSATRLKSAQDSLKLLGAFDGEDRLTELGRRMASFPLPPRLGGLLALGEDMGVGASAARVAALLNERDFVSRATSPARTECDVIFRLDLLRERASGSHRIREGARQLQNLVGSGEGEDDEIRKLLLLSHRDRLCRRRGHTARGVMVGGRGVQLSPQSQVRESEFFVALQGVDLSQQADSLISLASGFDKTFLLENLGDEIEVTEDVHFDEEKGQFYSRRMRRFGDLAIDDPVLSPLDDAQIGDRLVEALIPRWDWLIEKHADLRDWGKRWEFLVLHEARFGDGFGKEEIRRVLELASFDCKRVSEILNKDLVGFVESVIGREAVQTLHKEVPARFSAPSGVNHSIQYEGELGAFVEIRLQEVFGLQTTPRLVFGRVPLTFRLLGPNFRPVQVTSDLAGFWKNGYVEVRKELRARYPKHSWPEDPAHAKPEAKGRRRS